MNSLIAELKRLTKEIKDRSLRPEKYHEAEVAVTKAAEHALALHEQVDQLRREHSKIEKQVRAWPKWWELQRQRRGRESLSVPDKVPGDARQRYLAISYELTSLAKDQAERAEEIKQAGQSLAALTLDPVAVSYRVEIKSCLELRQSFIEAKEQLPERHRQREAMQLLIDRELVELRPGWSHDDLRAFSVDLAARTEIDCLSDGCRERTTSHTKLTAKRDGDVASLERAREELAEIGSPRDITNLASVLTAEADYMADQKHSESIRGELTKLERKLAIQCRKLTPPLAVATLAPHDLPVPRTETIAEFEARFAEIREQLRTAKESVKDDEAARREIEQTLTILISNHAVPSLGERDAARQRRDQDWELVHRKYIATEPADAAVAVWLQGDPATSLPERCEQSVRTADDVADQIYQKATHVAACEELRRQTVVLEMRIEQKRQRTADLEQQQTELQLKWMALWQPCGFEPLAPDAMLGWIAGAIHVGVERWYGFFHDPDQCCRGRHPEAIGPMIGDELNLVGELWANGRGRRRSGSRQFRGFLVVATAAAIESAATEYSAPKAAESAKTARSRLSVGSRPWYSDCG